jgi:ABC-type multidrug transport system permease subunit
MYRVSPLTYFLEGLAVAGLHNAKITCSSIEELHLPLPADSGAATCGEYLSTLALSMNGEVVNPSSNVDCRFCPLAKVNSVLDDFGMTVDPWRDVGLLAIYVCFNIIACFGIYWLARTPQKKNRS